MSLPAGTRWRPRRPGATGTRLWSRGGSSASSTAPTQRDGFDLVVTGISRRREHPAGPQRRGDRPGPRRHPAPEAGDAGWLDPRQPGRLGAARRAIAPPRRPPADTPAVSSRCQPDPPPATPPPPRLRPRPAGSGDPDRAAGGPRDRRSSPHLRAASTARFRPGLRPGCWAARANGPGCSSRAGFGRATCKRPRGVRHRGHGGRGPIRSFQVCGPRHRMAAAADRGPDGGRAAHRDAPRARATCSPGDPCPSRGSSTSPLLRPRPRSSARSGAAGAQPAGDRQGGANQISDDAGGGVRGAGGGVVTSHEVTSLADCGIPCARFLGLNPSSFP